MTIPILSNLLVEAKGSRLTSARLVTEPTKSHTISRCPGVTYWFSGRSLMDKSGQATAGCWREPYGELIRNGSNHKPSVNSHLSNSVTIFRNGSFPRRISKLR
jgi:hypothetical protein